MRRALVAMTAMRVLLAAFLGAAPVGAADAPSAPPTTAALAAAPTPATLPVITLAEALATARDHQPTAREAAAATAAARAAADVARAAMLPQVTANANYERLTANSVSRPGTATGGRAGESWTTFPYNSVSINGNLLLWDFGQASGRWRAARVAAESQRDSEVATAQQVAFNVRTAYFQARAAKELVGVAQRTLDNQQKHLEQTQGFVDVGTQPPIALAQSRTNVANAEVQRIAAENGYDTARAQLAQAMGVERSIDFDVADESAPPLTEEDAALDELVATAIRARPDLLALQARVEAQELTVKSVRASYAPSLSLGTSLDDAGQGTGNLSWNGSAALQLGVPIYLGGETRAQVAEAEANLAGDRAQVDAQRLQVRLDVEQARLALRAAKAALAASADALANARDSLELAEGRYETGVGTILELDDAQVALTAAEQQSVQAEYTLAEARAQLTRALGRE